MKAQKQLSDYPEFVRINSTVEALRTEKAEVSSRLEQIALELSQPREQLIDGQSAWNMVLEGEGTVRSRYAADNRSELRDEQIQLEGRQQFLDEALAVGLQKLDQVVGQASLEICESVRPQWIAEIKVILECLKRICESNLALDRMRGDLERQGVRTGSLAYAKYDIGGEWGSQYGGRLVGHQRHIAENYPQLVAAAGMSVKSKLTALSKREEEFREGSHLE